MAANDLTPKAPSDFLEVAQNKALQLHAMLTTITGHGGESLRMHNLTIQENYLWACAELAEEVCNLLEKADAHEGAQV